MQYVSTINRSFMLFYILFWCTVIYRMFLPLWGITLQWGFIYCIYSLQSEKDYCFDMSQSENEAFAAQFLPSGGKDSRGEARCFS